MIFKQEENYMASENVNNFVNSFLAAAVERSRREDAEWSALPKEEQQRLITKREQERLEKEKQQAQKEREEQIRKWRESGIKPRYFDSTWENWKAETNEQKNHLEEVRQYAWERNLFIVGNNGTGKTHIAMCLVKDGATYCSAPKLFRTVRDNLKLEQEIISKYGSCKLFILDEVGRQKGTDFERNLLFEIIDERWENMLPTTIIGNFDQNIFVDLYGTAIIDRLRPDTVEFNWSSKR